MGLWLVVRRRCKTMGNIMTTATKTPVFTIEIKNTGHLTQAQLDTLLDELREGLFQAVFTSIQLANIPEPPSGNYLWSSDLSFLP
jgi:hypothetical protein